VYDEKRSTEHRGGGILDGPSVWPLADARTDGSLVDAVARGDRDALLEVFDAHAVALYGVARRRCLPAQSASVVEAVILGLWHRPEEFTGAGCTLWTFLVSRVRILSAAAAGRIAEPSAVGPWPGGGGDDSALARAVGPTMAGRLRRLPDEEREVIELVYVGGHSCTSSADVLGRPREVVAAQITSGIAGLRAQRVGDDSWDGLFAVDLLDVEHDGDPCP